MSRFGEIVFVLLLTTPLVAAPGLGPDAARIPFAAACVALLFARAAWGAARKRETSARSDPLRTAIAILFAAALLSLVGAVDRWSSIVPLIVLGLGVSGYLFVTGDSLSRTALMRKGLPALAVVGIGLAACAIGQRALGRPAVSAIGNTNTAGAMFAMLLPFALAMTCGTHRRALFWISAAILLIALILTGSRGGIVGATAGSFVALGAVAWHRKRWKGVFVVAAFLTVAATLSIPLMLGRSETVRVRLGLWKGAWRSALRHPIVGCGIGNFSAQIPPLRSEEEFRISNERAGKEYVEAEDAHSTWVQIAAEWGIVGLSAFLLFVYVAARLWRYYVTQAGDPETVASLAGAGGGAAAFLVAGLFNSLQGQAAHTLVFFLFLGIVEQAGNTRIRRRRGSGSELRLGGHVALTGLAFFSAVVTANWAVADRLFQQGMRAADPAERARYLERSLEYDFQDWRIHYELGGAHFALERFTEAEIDYGRALEHRPHDPEALIGLARAKMKARGTSGEADALFDRAIRAAPYYYKSYYSRGGVGFLAGDWPGARAMFDESIRRRPTHALSYVYRGLTYAREGGFDAALADFRRARELDPASLKRLREDPQISAEPRFSDFLREGGGP